MSSGKLVIISCNEPDPRIDPARYINLSTNANSTSVIKTAGGRTEGITDTIHNIDETSRVSMIVIIQHTGCAWAPGNSETNVCSDISALKNSQHLRREIPVIGYVLDVETVKLKEVSVPRSIPDEETRRKALNELEDFAPFWN